MLIRNLLLLVIIIAAIWIIRSLMSKPGASKSRPAKSKDMVQCDQCKTYLPVDDAIQMNGRNFCSQQHLQDWNNRDI